MATPEIAAAAVDAEKQVCFYITEPRWKIIEQLFLAWRLIYVWFIFIFCFRPHFTITNHNNRPLRQTVMLLLLRKINVPHRIFSSPSWVGQSESSWIQVSNTEACWHAWTDTWTLQWSRPKSTVWMVSSRPNMGTALFGVTMVRVFNTNVFHPKPNEATMLLVCSFRKNQYSQTDKKKMFHSPFTSPF